jgi:hypothetical protein
MTDSATQDGHTVKKRHLERRELGGWAGQLTCACGWSVDVGPFRTSYNVSDVMAEEWVVHIGEASDSSGWERRPGAGS